MKNKSIKTTAVLLIIAMWIGQITAQNNCGICYTYDAAGNRTISQSCSCNSTKIEAGTEIEVNVPEIIGDFVVSPNPTTGRFIIRTEKTISPTAKVRIVNMKGEIVLQPDFSNGEFDLKEESTGTYFIYIKEEGKREKHLKFAKIDL